MAPPTGSLTQYPETTPPNDVCSAPHRLSLEHPPPNIFKENYSPRKISGTSASSSINSGSGTVKPSLPFNQKVVCSPLPCGRQKRQLLKHRGGEASSEVKLPLSRQPGSPWPAHWKRCAQPGLQLARACFGAGRASLYLNS